MRNVRSQDPPLQILTATFLCFSSCGRAQQTRHFAKFRSGFISHSGLKITWKFRTNLKYEISHGEVMPPRNLPPPLVFCCQSGVGVTEKCGTTAARLCFMQPMTRARPYLGDQERCGPGRGPLWDDCNAFARQSLWGYKTQISQRESKGRSVSSQCSDRDTAACACTWHTYPHRQPPPPPPHPHTQCEGSKSPNRPFSHPMRAPPALQSHAVHGCRGLWGHGPSPQAQTQATLTLTF